MAAVASQEQQLRALVMRAIELPFPLHLALDSLPPGTLTLHSQLQNSNIVSISVAFINQSLQLINDLSSSIKTLINRSTKELASESYELAAPAPIDEQMREEAVRNATQLTNGRVEQIGQNRKDKGRKEGSGTTPKKRKPSATASPAGGVRGSSGGSYRRSRNSTYHSNEVITVHCTSENPDHFDHYTWRKYGEKTIHGTEKRRAYYRCTRKHDTGCLAMKRVQACESPTQGYSITYVNNHTCKSVSLPHNPLTSSPSLDVLHTKTSTTTIANNNQPAIYDREPFDILNPLNTMFNCDPLFIKPNTIATNYTSTPTQSANDNCQTFSQELESITSSACCLTPSSSQPSLDELEVSFPFISEGMNAMLHPYPYHQDQTNTSSMAEAYFLNPPCHNDNFMYPNTI